MVCIVPAKLCMCCQVVESPDYASRLDQSVIQEFIVAHWVVKTRRNLSTAQSIFNNLWNLTTWHWTYEVINKGVGVFRVTKQLGKAGETCKLCDCLNNKFDKLKYKTFLVTTTSKAKVSKIRPSGRLPTAHVKNTVLPLPEIFASNLERRIRTWQTFTSQFIFIPNSSR